MTRLRVSTRPGVARARRPGRKGWIHVVAGSPTVKDESKLRIEGREDAELLLFDMKGRSDGDDDLHDLS